MIKVKKTCLLFSALILLAVLSGNFLTAQEIPPYHKSGIKYDYRTLILQEPKHNFDVLHYRFDWKIDFSSSFIKEKYGMAEIPGGTAMEHQTCTSYPEGLITGNHKYDLIIAHELAHQWWGDLVTLLDWADIWLNEGFATYSDALWQEHLTGFNGLKKKMAEFRNIYFNRHQGSEHPIYNPPEGHLFCSIEYEKAARVLHMLRHIVGDENFWKILRQYAQIYAYSNASTKDFQHICEQIFGSSLYWFFNQWIYQAGYPKYQFGWCYFSQDKVRVIINQIQEDFPLFIMPIDLVIKTFSGEIKKTVWVDEKYNAFDFSFEERPVDVLFDPDDWILCQVEPYQKKGKSRR